MSAIIYCIIYSRQCKAPTSPAIYFSHFIFLQCLCLSLLWCFHPQWYHPHSHPLWPFRLRIRAACLSMGTFTYGVFSQSESNAGACPRSVWFVRSRCECTLMSIKASSLKEEWNSDSAQLQEVSQTSCGLWAGIFIYTQASWTDKHEVDTVAPAERKRSTAVLCKRLLQTIVLKWLQTFYTEINTNIMNTNRT